jgi:uncharacterized protein DUF5667
MQKRTRTEGALDAALDALLAGDKQSLLKAIRIVENHPRAQELRHLLTSAIETREAMRATPSDQARVRHLRMIGVACREQDRAQATRKVRDVKRMRRLVLRPVAIAGASLGLLIPGTLALASSAQPGDALYGTKLTVEQVQLALTTSPEAEIALHLKFADRRMEEVQRLERSGGDIGPAVKTAADNLQSHTAAVKDAVQAMSEEGHPPADLTGALERHRDVIAELAGKAGCDRSRSSAGCEGLQSALANSMSTLKQLKDESRPGGAGENLAGKTPDESGAPAKDKPKPDKDRSPAKPTETTPASPTTTPSESTAPATGTDPSSEPSPSPSPEPSPSPTPEPSVSPSPDPTQEPSSPGDPTPAVSSDSSGAPADSPAGASPNGADTIEPHSTGEVPTTPIP